MKAAIEKGLKEARFAKDKETISVLSLMLNNIQFIEKEEKRVITDAEVTAILQAYIKNTKENEIPGHTKLGNTDRITVLEKNMATAAKFLPQQLSEAEVLAVVSKHYAIIKESVQSVGVGDLMKAVMPELKGKAAGKLINETVNRVIKSEEAL
jgi:uncharacterized protein YqeY